MGLGVGEHLENAKKLKHLEVKSEGLFCQQISSTINSSERTQTCQSCGENESSSKDGCVNKHKTRVIPFVACSAACLSFASWLQGQIHTKQLRVCAGATGG